MTKAETVEQMLLDGRTSADIRREVGVSREFVKGVRTRLEGSGMLPPPDGAASIADVAFRRMRNEPMTWPGMFRDLAEFCSARGYEDAWQHAAGLARGKGVML